MTNSNFEALSGPITFRKMISPGVEALLSEPGPFVGNDFASGQDGLDYMTGAKVLVIGAGGLGCEVLKSLSTNGFKDVHVIDMDTIDVSNLNRQFLFRDEDVGKSKAEVAARFIMQRNPSCKVTPHFCKIQDMPDDFYSEFYVVIGGLDSVSARFWINQKLVSIAQKSNNENVIPYIDGGSEEWNGHVKFILPNENACMQCQSDTFTQPTTYQECTLATTPRKPEHCISWAFRIAWDHERKNETVDGDNDEHITWIRNKAIQHARKFNLEEDKITFPFTKIVVKNTVAAIASTQAIVASMCVTEALKYITQTGPNINNNLNFFGSSMSVGVNINNYLFNRKSDCSVCGVRLTQVKYVEDETVAQLLDRLESDHNYKVKTLIGPNSINIVNPLFPQLKANLEKKISEFGGVGSVFLAMNSENQELKFILRE